MSLSTEVQGRYSSTLLIQVTNPQGAAATTLDTTRLNYSITDVEGQFLKRGMTYDTTSKQHNVVAVPGVYATLLLYNGHMGGKDQHDKFLKELDELREVDSRDKIDMDNDSELTPTEDTLGAKPQMDRSYFTGMVPHPPRSGSDGRITDIGY